MSSVSEYRKKLIEQYSGESSKKKDDEEEKKSNTSSTNTSSTQTTKPYKKSSYREELLKKYTADKVKSTDVDKWFDDVSKVFKDIEKDNTKDYSATIKDLLNSSKDVYNFSVIHKDEMNDYDTWNEAFSNFRSALRQYDKWYYDKNYQQEKIADIKNMSVDEIREKKKNTTDDSSVAYFDEDGTAVTWETLLRIKGTEGRIAEMQNNPALKPAYDELINYSDDIGRIENAQAALSARKEGLAPYDVYEKDLAYVIDKYGIDPNLDMEQPLYEIYMQLIDGSYKGMTEQKAVLENAGYDWTEVDAYRDYFKDKERAKELQKSYEIVAEDFPALATIFSIASAPGQIFDYAKDLVSIAQNAGASDDSMLGMSNVYDNNTTNFTGTITSTVADKIDKDVTESTGQEWLGWLASSAYSGGTSALQSALTTTASVALFGPGAGSAISLGIQSSQAAASSFSSAIKNGSNNGEALALSISSAAAEAMFEKISLDHFLKISKGYDVTSMSALFKSLAKDSKNLVLQGLVESSEELFTEMANNLADDIINGDHSGYNAAVAQYKMNGYSEEEAKKMATQDYVSNIFSATLGGFIGGVSSGGVAVGTNFAKGTVTAIDYQKTTVKPHGASIIKQGSKDSLMEFARETAQTNSKLNKYIDKVTKKASDKNVGKLSLKVEQSLSKQNLSDITKRFEDKGIETKEAKKYAGYVNKLLQGEALTQEDKTELYKMKVSEAQIKSALADIVSDPESPINISEANLMMARLGLKGNITNELPKSSTAKVTETKDAIESGEVAVSEDGKAKRVSSNETVTIDKNNAIARIENVDGDTVVYYNTDKGEVAASDVSYASESDALVYEIVSDMTSTSGFDVSKANVLIKGYDPKGKLTANEYVTAISNAFRYGELGYSVDELVRDSQIASLPGDQRATAYKLGKEVGNKKVAEKQAKITSIGAIKSENIASTDAKSKKGRVHFDGKVVGKTLNETQRASLKTLDVVAKTLGIDIYVFESPVGKDGKRQGSNGWYDPKDNSIHIDLYSGVDGKGMMLFTAAHELTHLIRKNAPEKFKAFADFLFEEYNKSGKSVEEIIQTKRAFLEAKGRITSDMTEEQAYDLAYEEVVADSCEAMLVDSNAIETISKLKAQDKGLWQTIKDFIDRLVRRIRAAYKGLNPDSAEANYVRDMVDAAEKLQKLWTEALAEAAETSNLVEIDKEKGIYSDRDFSYMDNDPVIEIAADDELTKRIQNSDKSKYTVIRDYLVEKFYGQSFTLSDGIEAIMDKRDAQELSHKADSRKQASLSNLREIVERARFSHSALNVKHNKFDAFRYYSATVSFEGEAYGILLNVGHSKYKDEYHIYDITKKGSTANQSSTGLSRPVGNAMKNSSSENSVSQDSGFVNEKFSERDSSYTDAVNRGDMEAAQRMVDKAARDAGYTNLFYHGAKKGGGFTEFRDWSYFTENKEYAKRYTDRNAPGSLYTTYVKLDNPFDTRKPADRKLFDSIRNEYGLSEVQDTGLPDWTDGYDIADYIDENELDYDGIILDEGGDLVDGKPVSRGLSYVIRKSAQIKSADPVTYDDNGNVIPLSERFNTDNNDIRYSDRYQSAEENPDILSMTAKVESGNFKANEKVFFGIVPDAIAQQIQQLTGIKVNGFKVAIEARQIEHILKDHGKQGLADKSMANPSHIAKMEYALNNPDDISRAGKTQAYTHMVNGRNRTVDTVLYEKNIGTKSYYVVQAVPDTKAKTLYIVTAFIGKEGYKKEAPQLINAKSLDATAKTGSVDTSTNIISHPDDSVNEKFSDRVTDQETLDFLNNQKSLRVYRAMQVIDGELYPPMAAKVKSEDGKKKLVTPSEIGAWEQAVERPDLIRNGNKFELDKANGSSIQAAYNPYFHTSASPLNDQFSSAYKRPNLVIVEGEIPSSELTSGYRAEFAKDTVGETKWHSGPVASKLKGDKARRVFLSRWFKPVRIVPDAEVAAIIAETLNGENLDVPFNVVTPTLRAELEKVGVSIKYSDRPEESMSNRAILANALKSTANSEAERELLAKYKTQIDEYNAEERKLHDLRRQIKDLSFAKGTRETKRLKELQLEANKSANRINIYDKRLLKLESAKNLKDVLEREKKRAYQRAEKRGKEALAKYKKEAKQRIDNIIAENREKRTESIIRRKSSELRTKIKKFKESLERSLQRPTDNVYVPAGLVQSIIDVCSLIDTDTDLYKADGSLNKAQEKRNLTKEKLLALSDEYKKLGKDKNDLISSEFDEAISDYLDDIRQKFSGKSLADMEYEELVMFFDILKSINETLRDARKLIGRTDAQTVYEAADSIIAEQSKITKSRKKGKRNAAQRAKDSIIDLSLSPVRNVERMSGYNQDSELVKLFNDFEKGVRQKNFFAMNAYKAFEELTTGKNSKAYDDAIYKEYGDKKYTDVNGRKFGISKMQMMQTILSYEREVANNMHHIEGSGFAFADMDMLRKGKLKEAVSEEYSHRIPAAIGLVEEFRNSLANDQWAQDYMEAARKFFNGTAKDAINETYLTLKHRIIARDKNYIPFEVDKNFVVREISAQNDIQQTINSYGMLKETKDGASQPLIITGLNNILDRHIEQVGNVYGLAVPVRNFNKVWNVRSIESGFGDPTVQAAIQRNWGLGGTKHITQTVQDLQGARPNTQSDLYRKVKSGYIGATFLLNLSVVTKQIGSLYSATSMLKWRGAFRMTTNLIGTMINYKKISAEVDKYTATAWMRRQGLSDAELYTLLTESKKPGLLKFFGKFPTVINPAKWITAMDSTVALSLWKYAKQDTAKRTGLKGEELLRATAEFYDSVVENTQSMTDVLHRPEIQKRSDVVSEAFGMFKTDLYQMAGQLQVSLGRLNANKNAENGKALGRAVYAVLRSAIWGSLMTSLFALLRYKVNPYRDEEDKDLTIWSWLKRQLFGLGGDFAGYLFPLGGSEFIGVIENIMYGESEDIVDSLAMTAINDLYDAMITVGSAVKDGEMPSAAQYEKLVVKALQVFGVPANNIKRIVDAITLHVKDTANGQFFSFEAGAERTAANYMHGIVDEIVAGNTDEAEKRFDKAVEDKGEANLRTALGNMYKDGEVDADTTKDILSEYFGMNDDEIYWQLDKWEYAKENDTSEGYAKYDDFYNAVESGKNLKAVIKQYTDNGVEKKTLSSQITKYFKPLYIEMSRSERANLKGYLLNAYVQLGYNRNEKSKDIDKWLED